MWLFIVLFLFIVFIILFFVLPLQVVVDSDKQLYYLQIPFYIKIQIVPQADLFRINGRVLFYPFSLGLDSFVKKEAKVEKQVITKIKKRDNVSMSQVLGVGKDLFGAVTIHHLYATLDTGNHLTNARLIPLVSMVNRNNVSVRFNFMNCNWVDARVFTRLYRIVWVLLKNLRFNK